MQDTNDLWKYLAHYPVVEAILAIFTLIAAGAAIFRGSWDKRTGGMQNSHDGSVGWNPYTVQEAMQIIREIAEHTKDDTKILERIEETMKATGRVQWEICNAQKRIEHTVDEQYKQLREQTQLLEDLRNNQVMRIDGSIGLPRRK